MKDLALRWTRWLTDAVRQHLLDAGLLFLRVGLGATMMLAHGWGKLTSYGEKADSFPDPLGVGSPLSMALAVFAEFFCSLLLIAGLGTRLAAANLIVTMAVAFFLVHGDDPWQRKELAFVYLLPYVALFLTGPGRWSCDALIVRWLGAAKGEA